MVQRDDIHKINLIFNFSCLGLLLGIKIFPRALRMLQYKGRAKSLKGPQRKKPVSQTEFSEICLDFESVIENFILILLSQ